MTRTIAIESALEKESLAFFELEGPEPVTECGVTYAVRDLGDFRLVAAYAGMGKINAAATAQMLVDRFSPDALLFSGIAGSLNPRIGEGDVVVGARLECLDADMPIVAEGFPYLESFPSDTALVAAAEAELEARGFSRVGSIAEEGAGDAASFGTLEPHEPRYATGGVATSDLFSTDPDVLESIRRDYRCDCEEMEGVAAAQVAARAQIPFCAIRSISNVCGEDYDALDGRIADLFVTARLAADVTLGAARRYVAGA